MLPQALVGIPLPRVRAHTRLVLPLVALVVGVVVAAAVERPCTCHFHRCVPHTTALALALSHCPRSPSLPLAPPRSPSVGSAVLFFPAVGVVHPDACGCRLVVRCLRVGHLHQGTQALQGDTLVAPRLATLVVPRLATLVVPRLATLVAPRLATLVAPRLATLVPRTRHLVPVATRLLRHQVCLCPCGEGSCTLYFS